MITLTFDDCYMSQKQGAQELLKKHNIRASFYVITNHLDDTQDYYMSKSDIVELLKDGHEIGSHTKSHPELSKIPESQIVEEVHDSKKVLLEMGIEASTFVYPYGAYNARVIEKVKDAGYVCARTTKFGYNSADSDLYTLKCQPVFRWVPFFVIKHWINKAQKRNLWLILMFHQINTKTMKYYGCSPKMFKRIVEYISSRSIHTVTVAEGAKLMKVLGK